jgi:predicted lipid-binding transport protein (Tim44 family)
MMKVIAVCIVLSVVSMPTLSVAKARGGSGGGFSSGSRGGGSSGSMGSRGARTYQDNGAKPIEQSTTARPAATPPSSSASNNPTAQTPAAQPSWLQRNPLLAGIAGGLAGSWIGHMIFGATDSSARSENGENGEQAGGAAGPNWMLILLMAMGAGGLYYYLKGRRKPAPDFSGLNRRSAVRGSLLAESEAIPTLRTATVDRDITRADKTVFQQSLTDIQTAWSRQDLSGLRKLVTPEMLEYFSAGLAEQASQGIENHVEDVVLQQADIRETWIENTVQYATVNLTWTARDYSVSTAKQPGETGYVIEGNRETPIETTEVWTFMRYQHGKWLLSAIQQVA